MFKVRNFWKPVQTAFAGRFLFPGFEQYCFPVTSSRNLFLCRDHLKYVLPLSRSGFFKTQEQLKAMEALLGKHENSTAPVDTIISQLQKLGRDHLFVCNFSDAARHIQRAHNLTLTVNTKFPADRQSLALLEQSYKCLSLISNTADEAVQHCEERLRLLREINVAEIHPNYVEGYNQLGLACLANGNFMKAADCYRKALTCRDQLRPRVVGQWHLENLALSLIEFMYGNKAHAIDQQHENVDHARQLSIVLCREPGLLKALNLYNFAIMYAHIDDQETFHKYLDEASEILSSKQSLRSHPLNDCIVSVRIELNLTPHLQPGRLHS